MPTISQPIQGFKLLLSTAMITLSNTEMFRPPDSSRSTTPWNARNAARVTTNDGMPTFDTRKPSRKPIAVPMRIDTITETYQTTWWSVSSTHSTAPHRPLVKPADRSISPSSSTKIRPIAMMTTCPPWVNRLAKLPAEKNTGRSAEKTSTSTTRPSVAGSEPMSPPRRRPK
jgi:hypothetical protein